MRATLEQLKAMNDKELFVHWGTDRFPFDRPIGCSRCLTFHGRPGTSMGECHPQLKEEILKLQPSGFFINSGGETLLRKYLEELYALRLFYDALYPQVVEAAEEKTITESAPSLVAQG